MEVATVGALDIGATSRKEWDGATPESAPFKRLEPVAKLRLRHHERPSFRNTRRLNPSILTNPCQVWIPA